MSEENKTTDGAPKSEARSPVRMPSEKAVQILRRNSQILHRREMRSNPAIKILALVAGLVLVAALAVDLFRESRRFQSIPRLPSDQDPSALILGLQDRIYRDPRDRFQLRVPASWAVFTSADIAPYDVLIRGPRGIEISIRSVKVEEERFDLLLEEIRGIEEQWGVNMNLQTNVFRDRPSAERYARLITQSVRIRDFLADGHAHHLQAAAPREAYEALEPLLLEIMATYEPGPFPPNPE
ncbi:MAG: hypothetical protein U1E27_07270 [Kiritimatiellia bacterium]|nr:hypothetical protein [Kiritimatiellia bacterium]